MQVLCVIKGEYDDLVEWDFIFVSLKKENRIFSSWFYVIAKGCIQNAVEEVI